MLTIVPTPIGNLRDITLRALDILKSADAIICEDTRRTQKLLSHYEIRRGGVTPPLLSLHEHSGPGRLREILELLKEGKHLALVSDSGMPLVSDPGFELVRALLQAKMPVEILPGPSAILPALVASGLATDCFAFFGFLPQRSAQRKRRLQDLGEREETLIFYESPFRVLRTLQEMKETFGNREAAVARELTKKFEEIARGYLSELIEKFSKRAVKGEIVIVVAGKGRKEVLH